MLTLIGGFVYLVMMGHTGAGGTLLGAGVLGIILAFIRARLRKEQEGPKAATAQPAKKSARK